MPKTNRIAGGAMGYVSPPVGAAAAQADCALQNGSPTPFKRVCSDDVSTFVLLATPATPSELALCADRTVGAPGHPLKRKRTPKGVATRWQRAAMEAAHKKIDQRKKEGAARSQRLDEREEAIGQKEAIYAELSALLRTAHFLPPGGPLSGPEMLAQVRRLTMVTRTLAQDPALVAACYMLRLQTWSQAERELLSNRWTRSLESPQVRRKTIAEAFKEEGLVPGCDMGFAGWDDCIL